MTSQAPVFLSALGIVSALGRGQEHVSSNLFHGRTPGVVQRTDLLVSREPIHVAEVEGSLPVADDRVQAWASRNSSLVLAALEQIRDQVDNALNRYGPGRVAAVIGTSTSGLDEGEQALDRVVEAGSLPTCFDFRQQELGGTSEYVARYLGLRAPTYSISTACSSSAHALASARRLLRFGLADAVIAGGADSLCRLTINGFNSLSALSSGRCNPFSRNRDGTMIGEGAAIFLVEKEESEIALFGVGDSSEAHSMTAPEPEGRGIEQAMRRALQDAQCDVKDVGYIQLHGTATEQNDAAESKVILRLFGDEVPCSSSKPQIGHTLGAAGAMGAAHCWLVAHSNNKQRLLPPNLWDGASDPGLLSTSLVTAEQSLDNGAPDRLISNAFAFGGSNISLVIGRWH